jgi:hypothetical protein
MAQEAIELHVSGMVEDGDELPSPSSLEVIMADPENSDAVAFLVTLPEAVDRTVRVNITLSACSAVSMSAPKTARRSWLAPRRRLSPRADPAGREPLRAQVHTGGSRGESLTFGDDNAAISGDYH